MELSCDLNKLAGGPNDVLTQRDLKLIVLQQNALIVAQRGFGGTIHCRDVNEALTICPLQS
jgi:hypothetical protein